MKELPKEIKVVISGKLEYDNKKYRDNHNCYLAEALKNLDYEKITVFGFGSTKINKTSYKPLNSFHCGILRDNMDDNLDTHVTLVRV